ncbi:hypothetical protein HYPSUDRAFT_47244 [Hypholoma sublateritium FD-334 SS-4]|uniref:F-box domain-containing protein n=1 Tax=Hypholoma sublateritium (strain FD-334 SS-4) TaxID=945553 RepID=A0A0D2NBW5_HYPSF|nr:hypothetical protein HYPSUDRAFT_47244 [Hypholoma sublateritium FD-334 SS-4]
MALASSHSFTLRYLSLLKSAMLSGTRLELNVSAHEVLGPELPDSMPRSILSLAPELIHIITDELDTHDLECLRLTCKTLAHLLRSRVFRVLSIKVTKDSLQRDVTKLRELAMVSCPASSGTQTLRIGSLTPSYDPNYKGPTWKYVDGEWVAEADEEDSPEVLSAVGEMKKYLFDAIFSLKALRKVEWTPHREEDETTQTIVVQALSSLPNLCSVAFCITHCKVPLPFDLFSTGSTLRKISLAGTCEPYHDDILDSLAKLIAKTPSLMSIDIASNWRYNQPINKTQSLHELFKYYPRSEPPLRLRHLGLKVCLVRLDEFTLSHLRQLTSLELTSIEDPYTRQRYIQEDEYQDGTLLSEQKKYGSSLDEVWSILRDAEVHLEEITVDVVVPALLDYLHSYSGVKKLIMTPGGFDDGIRSDAMASEFFAASLANHKASLQELAIKALFEGAWCLSAGNLSVISACQSVKTLKLSIMSDQLSYSAWQKVDTVKPDIIKLFLDTVASTMPRVESLVISPANLEHLRGAYCGGPSMSHFSHTTQIMVESVEAYRAPQTCTRLPVLTIGPTRLFVEDQVIDSEGRKMLSYVDNTPLSEEPEYSYW